MPHLPEADRQRAIRLRLARMESGSAIAVIPTGFATLDRALGGGFPRGRIVELFGPSSCGKTTLVLQIIARLQKNACSAAWIDAEHSFDPSYADLLGVAVERLPVAQPDSAEQALEMVHQLASSGAVDLVAVDSAAALVPQLELETGIGESGAGLQGRVLASGLRKLAITMAKTATSLVFLNQARSRMDSPGGEAETSAGGAALKLYAAVRIAFGPGTGDRVRFRVVKNKVAAAFEEGELEWSQGSGFAETP
jgi:recombination protein RecA